MCVLLNVVWALSSFYQISSQLFYHTVPGQASFLILSVFIFSPATGISEIKLQQKDVARPEIELTSSF